ncbi:MAG: beta-ketoacyl synthase N-terminal-like domain-containing protein [Lysobacterales bacterium]
MTPIAIVGRGAVLPGALSPEALWQAVLAGRDLSSAVDPGRWRLPPEQLLCAPDAPRPDRCWSDRGGYVRGFEAIWDPHGFALPASALEGLDPLVHWTLHCARAALADLQQRPARAGAVLGNLGFPSESMAAFADQVWRGKGEIDPRNRWMSAGTAATLAQALDLSEGAFCLDAACASSLYAIALACQQLEDGRADLMLAGAVQRADDLFLHQGFAALGALSKSGQSRPFHPQADGLLPAEGCVLFALKRLADARQNGDTVYAVIRGIGLGNDGRGRGPLVPDGAGQQRAMRAAYAAAAIDPTRVSLLECHATGTPVGDRTEILSSAAIFAGARDLPIGSLKSNLGHLITAAGAAGILKLIEALRHDTRPPNRPLDAQIDALADSPFRLLQAPEPWPRTAPRIAAISAFGFGGNNAHLILSDDDPALVLSRPRPAPVSVRVVARADRIGEDGDPGARMQQLTLDLAGLRIPPNDLRQMLPQQALALQLCQQVLAQCELPVERTAVLIGMEPDADVARFGTRWQLTETASERDAVVPALTAAGVLGCMPNMPANRLNAQWDLRGPSYTVQAGADSARIAFDIATRALVHGEIDAAIVGNVDFGHEVVNRAAGGTPVDAGVLMVLMRGHSTLNEGMRARGHAKADLALPDSAVALQVDSTSTSPHQASLPEPGEQPATACPHALVPSCPPGSTCPRALVPSCPPALSPAAALLPLTPPGSAMPPPQLYCYAGADRAAVVAALSADQRGLAGPARLVLLARPEEWAAVRARALAHLQQGTPPGSGVHYCDRPIQGEIAFVFASAGASYAGMGRELLQALPELVDYLGLRSRRLAPALAWAYDASPRPSAQDQLWGASALSQMHLELSQRLLGLRADAWLGYSSGETNALVAAGVWRDPDALMAAMEASGLMTTTLGGEFAAVAPQWGTPVRWASWNVLAPVDDIRAALAGEARVHLAIIHSDNDAVIAGDAEGCERVVEALGRARCLALDYPLAVHVPELEAVADQWLALHQRRTYPLAHGRMYASASGQAYAPSQASCAQAILAQARGTLDLRPAILQSWQDGVRIYLEHGPGSTYARAIRSTLGEREALVLSLDRKGQGVEGALNAVAALLAAGVPLDPEPLLQRLTPAPPYVPTRPLTLPAHWPPVRIGPQVEQMAPAPTLPSALAAWHAERAAALAPSAAIAPTEIAAAPSVPTAQSVTAAPVMAQLRAEIERLSTQQRAHEAHLLQAHQRYLALATQAQALLLRAAQAGVLPEAPVAAIPASAAPAPAPEAPPRATPRFDRAALEIHADGRISEIFGPAFAGQDGYARQVRMPRPPLLLADRVTALSGEPGSMGRGHIETETDVHADAWYLHHGRMPAGVMIEAGQADLMLISWLGVDALNRGERVYRLLGCELTYHGDLPAQGDTLHFDIHLDGHAAQGEVRLMFFHYDCHNGGRPQLSVRGGQAGFFTDAELAASAGCLWSPETQAIVPQPRLDPPAQQPAHQRLDRAQLEAFAAGDLVQAFGPAYALARTHTRSPGIHAGRMLLLDRVTELALNGGPWQRGYLRAELDIHPQQWFFDGHFKNDPCMPGTLMFEACLQAMAVYLAACGYTLRRDGWRFQPVPEQPYALQCRGQVTPRSRLLVTEVYIEERSAGPRPTIYADLLCTVDGLKAFHARRVGLELVPDWPLAARRDGAPGPDAGQFDAHAILASACGRPSEAFGVMYARFDGGERAPRLPSPPYLFVSRIAAVHGPIGQMRAGARVVAEYDVPVDAWYLAAHGARTMPFAVLLEAALQPCGWLASYVGSALTAEGELGFRNLDGNGTMHAELYGGETLVTEVELTEVSASAGMIIQSFRVACRVGTRPVYTLSTVFGFFPPAALAAQAGLPPAPTQQALLTAATGASVALDQLPARPGPRLPGRQLRMIDRIEGWWPQGGRAGLGAVRAVKDIDPGEWFFRAHFYQDPVQPGSLGLEAMLQTLEYALLQILGDRDASALRFEVLASGQPHRWKYRGQVLPHHRQVHTTLELTALDDTGTQLLAHADASLWVDGLRIYEANGLAIRVRPMER